jgi:hypothetical protein
MLAFTLPSIIRSMNAATPLRHGKEHTMSELSDCKPASGSGLAILPTRQKNALRLLLDKPCFGPEEIAALNYRILERAPGIDKNSLAIICAWLEGYGYELKGLPAEAINPREAQRLRKLERAIDYLHGNGYEVHRRR